MTNPNGLWVCWMSMGGKCSFKHTASGRVDHVVEVTAKRRLFWVTSVTPICETKNSPGCGPSQGWLSAVLGNYPNNCCFGFINEGQQRGKKAENTRTWWLSATLDLLFFVYLLALSHSGRHERTAVWTLLLCGGPNAGCSAVLAVGRYCCGYRSELKKKRKEEKKKQSRDRSGKNHFPDGNHGVRWEDMPSMSSEVGEI